MEQMIENLVAALYCICQDGASHGKRSEDASLLEQIETLEANSGDILAVFTRDGRRWQIEVTVTEIL